MPGKDLPGVIAYRDIADTNAMIEAAEKYKHAVVIGGGLLGLEAANGLMLRGMQVTVVHIMPWLMERQLDDVAGKLLQKSLEDRGLKFLIGAQTQALIGDERRPRDGRAVQGRHRDPGRPGGDGRRHPPQHRAGREDRPALQPAASSSATPCRPSPTRASTRSANAPRTAASPTAWWRRCSSRARSAPRTWREFGIGRYTGSQTSTKLKVTGIDLFSAGNFMRRRRTARRS